MNEPSETMPRVKFHPEQGYFVNPTPDAHGALGLSVYFGKTGDGEPSVAFRPKGGPEGSAWHISKEAALLVAFLIQVYFGVAVAAEDLELSRQRLFRRFFEVITRPDGSRLVLEKRTGEVYPLGILPPSKGREEPNF